MPEHTDSTPLANESAAGGTALLVVDMLSDWAFPDAGPLLEQAAPVAARIAVLAQRCRAAGVPVVYANDNQGRWRSDLRQVVAAAMRGEGAGARIARQLEPRAEDYIVLKPKHSGFYATPLDLLLRHLGVERLLLAGVATDQCVLYTAADAKMHDYDVVVARDCVASQNAERHEQALRHFRDAMKICTTPSPEIELPGARCAS